MVTIFSAAFGAVYELFSHGVYAYGMLYAFAFPLLGGLLPAFLLSRNGRRFPSAVSWQLWHFGISALTVGSLYSGALEIYGTSSQLTVTGRKPYLYASAEYITNTRAEKLFM